MFNILNLVNYQKITVLVSLIILILTLKFSIVFLTLVSTKPLVNLVIVLSTLVITSFLFKNIKLKKVFVITTLSTILLLFIAFTTYSKGLLYFNKTNFFFSLTNIFLDGISIWLLWLTLIVGIVLFFGISKRISTKFELAYDSFGYNRLIAIILILIAICFLTKNIFTFFIFFEMILIPLIYHIIVQGSRVNRLLAVKYLAAFTIVGSIFLWVPIAYFIEVLGTTDFEILRWLIEESTNSGTRKLLFLSLFLGFSFKVPLVPFHQWLIIAHVEAPTSGSIILAALLLKVGGYGLYRFVYNLFPIEVYLFSNEIITLAIFGYTYATLLAIRQIDIKRFIAYTSISHMNFSLIGLFSGYEIGIVGFLHTMISHGIIATGLFYLVGYIYSNLSYRDTLRLSGLAEILPIFSIFWFLFSIANMGMPLFSAFPGELFIMISLAEQNPALVIYLIVGFFFTGVYTFLQLNKILFGNTNYSSTFNNKDLSVGLGDISAEALSALVLLLLNSVILGICPDILLKNIEI